VLPDGSVELFGGPAPEPTGYDLRGLVVGSEGTCGIVTRACVRLTPNPEAVRTLLAAFDDVPSAAASVSGIIAAGVIPAALEMMDHDITVVVEDFCRAGYPRDAAAVLLIEVDGLPDGIAAAAFVADEVCRANGARSVRVAADEAERQALWRGRKSAFGALARLAPDYYLHDTVVPRTRLVEVLGRVTEICRRLELRCMNVFHAGDGNLHPLIAFDSREPGVLERVHQAAAEIVRVSVEAGGVLSGEHGIGIEKRDLMPLIFSAVDLDAQARVRDAFDPVGLCNPHKVLPMGSRCGDFAAAGAAAMPAGTWI
jgi:glycolate oxidase